MSRHHLYRHYDASGALLYVGESLSAFERLRQHKASAVWAETVAEMRIEYFETPEAAKAAERRAIKEESPQFNIRGVVGARRNGGKLELSGALGRPLNARQRAFCRAYALGGTLRAAYVTAGYSAKGGNATRLMKKFPRIRHEIAEIQRRASREAERNAAPKPLKSL